MLWPERQTVMMELAAALHHSRDAGLGTYDGPQATTSSREEVENEAHSVLLYQRSPPRGVRPGLLPEAGPQRSDRTVRRSAGDTPPLAMLVLAAAPDEALDSATLTFLVQHALEAKMKRRRRRIEEEAKLRSRRRRQRRQPLAQEFRALQGIPAERRSAQVSRINALIKLDEAEAAAASSSSQPGRRGR